MYLGVLPFLTHNYKDNYRFCIMANAFLYWVMLLMGGVWRLGMKQCSYGLFKFFAAEDGEINFHVSG